jgi:hypothetical protein
MALKTIPDKTAQEAAKEVRRIVRYVLLTNADALKRQTEIGLTQGK